MTNKGLTLIELVLAITLMSVVIFTAAVVNMLGSNFLVRLQEAAQLQQEATRAIIDITLELEKGNRYRWTNCWTGGWTGTEGAAATANNISIQQDRFAQLALYGGNPGGSASPQDYADIAILNDEDDVLVNYSLVGGQIFKSVQQVNGGAFVLNNQAIAGTAIVQIAELEFTRISYNCVNVRVRTRTTSGSERELSYNTRVVLRGTSFDSPY